MPHRRTRMWTVALAAGALALPAAAPATAQDATGPQTFRGETSQGRDASVVSDGRARVTRVRLDWRAACRRDGYRYASKTILRAPYDRGIASRLRDERVFRETSSSDVVGLITTNLTATRSGTGLRAKWSGTFTARVSVRRDGRTVDTCRTGTLRWSARLVTR